MLLNCIFLLKNYNAGFFTDANAHANQFIIPFKNANMGDPAIFMDLHQSKQEFCFSFSADQMQPEQTPAVIQNLVRFIFLPNYIRTNGKCLFFIEPGNDSNNTTWCKSFTEALGSQGVHEVMVETIETTRVPGQRVAIHHPAISNYLDDKSCGIDFEKFIERNDLTSFFDTKFIVEATTLDEIAGKATLISHLDSWLRLLKPTRVQLMEKYQVANQDNIQLRNENELLKTKLQNSSIYLRELRQQWFSNSSAPASDTIELGDENNDSLPGTDNYGQLKKLRMLLKAESTRANETLDWYKKEYEALPLWYKRFGQLIKVITGKRTFKSLFKN